MSRCQKVSSEDILLVIQSVFQFHTEQWSTVFSLYIVAQSHEFMLAAPGWTSHQATLQLSLMWQICVWVLWTSTELHLVSNTNESHVQILN